MMAGWEDIRAEVLSRIRSKAWPLGTLIPGEEALAQEFGVARATVNRALSELARSGVLERKRKAGTRVAMRPVRRATLEIPVIRQEVERRGQTYAYRLLADAPETPPLPVALRLRLPAGAVLRHLTCLHSADGRPFICEDRWLNPAALGGQQPDFAAQSANEWLVANMPYNAGDIAFSAAGAGADDAAAFGIDPGTPLFMVERATWTADTAITFVLLAYAPGYRLHMTL